MKDFDSWNTLKKKLGINATKRINFHNREIWWCSLGVNVGNEQDGVGEHFERPCVIIQKLSSTTCLALPLSTKDKLPLFQEQFEFKGVINFALLDQIRVVDAFRFRRKIGYLPEEIYAVIKTRLCDIIRQ